jgi:hypothetical protein
MLKKNARVYDKTKVNREGENNNTEPQRRITITLSKIIERPSYFMIS